MIGYPMLITTRSGAREPFDADKVAQTVRSLFSAQALERYPLTMIVQRVYELLLNVDGDPTTDTVQDAIEYALLTYGEVEIVRSFMRQRLLVELRQAQ